MACRTKIKQNVERKVTNLSEPGLTMSLQNAQVLATDINMMYNHHVVAFNNVDNQVSRVINIPSELVDKYYDIEIKRNIISPNAPVSNKEVDKLNADLNSLNLTSDVINYLYTNSRSKSMGVSLNTYSKEVQKLIGNLQVDFTNQEIVEKIKCL